MGSIAQASPVDEAREILDRLPVDSTWDDIMYEIYVRQAIEAGLADSKAGRVVEQSELRKRFGLSA